MGTVDVKEEVRPMQKQKIDELREKFPDALPCMALGIGFDLNDQQCIDCGKAYPDYQKACEEFKEKLKKSGLMDVESKKGGGEKKMAKKKVTATKKEAEVKGKKEKKGKKKVKDAVGRDEFGFKVGSKRADVMLMLKSKNATFDSIETKLAPITKQQIKSIAALVKKTILETPKGKVSIK